MNIKINFNTYGQKYNLGCIPSQPDEALVLLLNDIKSIPFLSTTLQNYD